MTLRRDEIARRRKSARSPRFEPSAISTAAGTSLLADVDVVGELVDVALGAREVRFELMSGRGDRFDDAFGELAVLESDGQLRRDLIPETGRHLVIDFLVAEDDETVLLGGDEEEHAVAQRGLGHAEAFERALGDVASVAASRLRLEVDGDFPGRFAFRRSDRGRDARLIERLDEFFLLHHPPPAPPPPKELPPPPQEPPVLQPPPPPPPPPPNVVPPPPHPPPPRNNGQMHPPQPLRRPRRRPRRSRGRI